MTPLAITIGPILCTLALELAVRIPTCFVPDYLQTSAYWLPLSVAYTTARRPTMLCIKPGPDQTDHKPLMRGSANPFDSAAWAVELHRCDKQQIVSHMGRRSNTFPSLCRALDNPATLITGAARV